MFKKILLAFDGSEYAVKAADYAIKLAQVEGGEVEILNVVPAEKRYLRDSSQVIHSIEKEMRQEAEQIIARGEEKFKDSGVKYKTKIIIGNLGDPADEIYNEAKDQNVDIIVMGSRGLNALSRFLGSVSNKVLTHAHCPVLIVR